MFTLTAAHRTLPLGTWVKVTNLHNGRSVVVRINDRGPVPESRIIDLSFEAATLLDLRDRGVGKVRLDLIQPSAVAEALSLNQLN
jgi:rare lipoprotein A